MRLAVLSSFVAFMVFVPPAAAQPSTAPPSSLPTTPLSATSNHDDASLRPSCDLCRPLQGRPGSDLKRHRLPRNPELRPHRQAPNTTKSPTRSTMNQLPHRKLGQNLEGEDR